ncbi:hypothetical protein CF166_13720 [Amycolatopsis sp. KNN50.9b]|nr:hypothetical protein CF166_13720 [Amycolatopsis sp. KNN50.9b]
MRIVVAEDLYLLRDGLVRLLEAYGHEVVATAATGPETLDALLKWRPDAAVVDVRMPPTQSDEGLKAALAARREVPGLPVLVLSQHVEQLYARELLAGPDRRLARLTEREHPVLALMAEGLSDQAIARRLFLYLNRI